MYICTQKRNFVSEILNPLTPEWNCLLLTPNSLAFLLYYEGDTWSKMKYTLLELHTIVTERQAITAH